MHGIHKGDDWTERKAIGNLIKEICFDSDYLDPAAYDKDIILAARKLDARFAEIDENLWLVAFRRAASECILKRDLEVVEARHRRVAVETPESHQPASSQQQPQPRQACTSSVASQNKQPGGEGAVVTSVSTILYQNMLMARVEQPTYILV